MFRRNRGEHTLPASIRYHHAVPERWYGVALDTRLSHLVFDGYLNTERYISVVLRSVVLHFIRAGNARHYVAGIALNFLVNGCCPGQHFCRSMINRKHLVNGC